MQAALNWSLRPCWSLTGSMSPRLCHEWLTVIIHESLRLSGACTGKLCSTPCPLTKLYRCQRCPTVNWMFNMLTQDVNFTLWLSSHGCDQTWTVAHRVKSEADQVMFRLLKLHFLYKHLVAPWLSHHKAVEKATLWSLRENSTWKMCFL